jgi:mannitol/fructose-specific phosphotransferase system IIA component (Ntr-type)
MKSLLNALQDGRLIELPDNNKNKSLEYLATLIEAIPDVGVEGGITESVMAREAAHNTGIGKGWACPHGRSMRDGELLCAVGWSPKGIDYGAPDGAPVHLVVMYFVPDPQKNAYLKEISSLAKAIQTLPGLQQLTAMEDLNEVRHTLLDAISVALEATAPEAKARMIQLEVKHAVKEAGELLPLPEGFTSNLVPLSLVIVPGLKPLILCQDRDLVSALESQELLAARLLQNGRAEHQGIHLFLRASSNYQPDRAVHECLAIRVSAGS